MPLKMRLTLPLIFEYGKVREDLFKQVPLEIGDTSDLAHNSRMYHIGVIPHLQFPFRGLSKVVWPILSLGGGVHYVLFSEELRPVDTHLRLTIIDEYLDEDSKNIVFSVSGGGGLEFKPGKNVLFSLSYFFRYWEPVRRGSDRGYYPYRKIPYTERFFTHSIVFSVMIPGISQ